MRTASIALFVSAVVALPAPAGLVTLDGKQQQSAAFLEAAGVASKQQQSAGFSAPSPNDFQIGTKNSAPDSATKNFQAANPLIKRVATPESHLLARQIPPEVAPEDALFGRAPAGLAQRAAPDFAKNLAAPNPDALGFAKRLIIPDADAPNPNPLGFAKRLIIPDADAPNPNPLGFAKRLIIPDADAPNPNPLGFAKRLIIPNLDAPNPDAPGLAKRNIDGCPPGGCPPNPLAAAAADDEPNHLVRARAQLAQDAAAGAAAAAGF